MKKSIAILAAAALLALALAGCAPSPQKLLAGKWQASAFGLDISSFEFTPDGKNPLKGTLEVGLLSGLASGSYTVTPGKKDEADRLEITYSSGALSYTQNYTFTVTEDTLSLEGDGLLGGLLGKTLSFKRAD